LSIWKNKHLLIATLTAPILGLLSYFAVNTLVSEKPQAAQAGQSYLLIEMPNCRYSSGQCGLKNGNFRLELSFDRLGGDRLLLKLKSEHVLDGVLLAQLANEEDESQPKPMRATGPDGQNWSMEILNPDPAVQRLHIVASSGASYYVGDVALKFTIDETASQ
jgi:hypothetical protein